MLIIIIVRRRMIIMISIMIMMLFVDWCMIVMYFVGYDDVWLVICWFVEEIGWVIIWIEKGNLFEVCLLFFVVWNSILLI